MESRKATNILLLLIFLALLAMIFNYSPIKSVSAETFRLDDSITTDPYSKPQSYVHVVVHDITPIQSSNELR